MKETYFILLPDGIGLRNFAYTSFTDLAKEQGHDLVFWNLTPFDIESLGYRELKAPSARHHKLTEVYKNARKNIELSANIQRTKDQVYNSYKFPKKYNSFLGVAKNVLISLYSKVYNSQTGLQRIRRKIVELEKSTSYYKECLQVLEKESPAVLFCTNQRPMTAIAAIEAAKSLDIPTVCFIFSWDNLPKATIVVEADYYFVWSEHMKRELLFYYPDMKDERVIVTGTPQFEGHFNQDPIKTKAAFFKEYHLDVDKNYICFSGDDITTSPNDPYYLQDTAEAVSLLNNKGYDIGIIFRRCPVDFSDRYDWVIEKYKKIIIPISPKWEQAGPMWNAIMPSKADTELLVNTAAYTDLVINVGSSMVFDYICHEKPCAFINYNTEKNIHPTWNIEHIYNYVHFQSMPDKRAVFWLNSKDGIAQIIEKALAKDDKETLKHARNWFDVIVNHPKEASQNIWKELEKIAK